MSKQDYTPLKSASQLEKHADRWQVVVVEANISDVVKSNGLSSGRAAEEDACRFLRDCGYEIVARNWRTVRGEIDIVARDGPTLVFVEVKSRSRPGFGGPEAAVHPAKQRRLIAAARGFLGRTDCRLPVRFDVVAFLEGEPRLHRDAFQVDETCSLDS